MRLRVWFLAVALTSALAGRGAAQVSLDTRVAVMSAFVFRGVTFTNRPVAQPSATVSLGPVSLGLWGNLEPVRYRGPDVLSGLAGRPAPGFTKMVPTLELGHRVGGVDLAAGTAGILFTRAAGYVIPPNTFELYGRMALHGALPLQLAVNYDAHVLKGIYVEAGVQRPLPGWSALVLGATVGASFGEADEPQWAFFQRDGLTHALATATLPLALGPLQLIPEADVELAIDGATRITSPTVKQRVKTWFGAALSWPRRRTRA